MFLTAKEVEESLERRETATCLAWCHDNKSRLRKMKVRPQAGGAGPLSRIQAPSPVGSEPVDLVTGRGGRLLWVWGVSGAAPSPAFGSGPGFWA